jgi:hypothetical protein
MSTGVEQSRRCPRCAEDIRSEAKRCPRCLTDLDKASGTTVAWLVGNLAIVIPAITFLYVAFQVFKAADFEVNTAVELVRESGISSIFLGVLLVQLPMELWITVLVVLAWLVRREGLPGKASGESSTASRRGKLANIALLCLAPVALALAISPWPLVLLSILVVAWAGWVSTTGGGSGQHGRRRSIFLIVDVIVAIASVVYLLSLPTIWMAAEDVHTAHHGDVVGYVVSSDDRFTTILVPTWTHRLQKGQNSIIRLDTKEIDSRSPCAIDFQDARAFGFELHLRPFQIPRLLVRSESPKPLTPACP